LSKKRQGTVFDPVGVPGALVTTFHHEYPDGFVFGEHYHDRDQVIFAHQGVMTVETSQGMWVLPTSRALWIPSGTPHAVRMSGEVSLRTLYFQPKLVRGLPRACTIVNISPLLKELVLYACQFESLNSRTPARRHVIEMLLDLLARSQTVPLQLPRPVDSRALKVADFLYSDPRSSVPMEELCIRAGASKRTIERLFREDTQMTLGRWRQQLRLMHGMRLLAQGMNINSVALEAGYSSPSAFILMFKNALGTTPGQYFQQNQRSGAKSLGKAATKFTAQRD
jgi:AraC-like DNA-binding protein/quercetin dioxygenase-like cupin family protein